MSQSEAKPTLREQITSHIIGQIMSGAWTMGSRIPSESALVTEFGTSRMTVHQVLRNLTQRGFLTRQKGSGTIVAEPRPYVSHYGHHDIIEEIERAGFRHTAHVVTQALRPAMDDEAHEFRLPPKTPLFHAVVVHSAEGKPFEVEDRLINPTFLADCLRINLAKRSLFSLLMLSRPLRDGEETARAVMALPEDQVLLGLVSPEPCLQVVRTTWTDDDVVTRARLLRAGPNAFMRGRIVPLPVQDERLQEP